MSLVKTASRNLKVLRRHGLKPVATASMVQNANANTVLVVPFPWNERVPVLKEYQELRRRQQTKPHFGFISLEGFLAAKMTVEGLRRAGPAPSRQRFVTALETMRDVGLGGYRVQLGHLRA